MAILVEKVYERTCDALLEPGGLQLGLLTETQFLLFVETVVEDFLKKTELVKDFFTTTGSRGVVSYQYVSGQLSLDEVYYDGVYLRRSDALSIDFTPAGGWSSETGFPERWFHDRSGPRSFGLYPAPDEDGKTITMFGAKNPMVKPLSLLSTIAEIPESFTFYIWAGIMAKIRSMDGELKDDFQASYFMNRYTEGVNIGRVVMSEALLAG